MRCRTPCRLAASRSECISAVERDRLPVDGAQSIDAAIEAAGDFAKAEYASQRLQIQVIECDIGRQRRRDTERTLHRECGHGDFAIEDLHAQPAFEVQPFIDVMCLRESRHSVRQ